MPKLHVGEKMPDFTYATPYTTGNTLAETVRRVEGKTAVVFLRYYGCTICQYDIHLFQTQYDKIAATGGQLLVVLQSDPAKLAAQLPQGTLPFDIICDPDQALYHQFDIRAASRKDEFTTEVTLKKRAERDAMGGFVHGEYEGEELQLPATFVVDRELNISVAEYHKENGAVPSPEALAELLK